MNIENESIKYNSADFVHISGHPLNHTSVFARVGIIFITNDISWFKSGCSLFVILKIEKRTFENFQFIKHLFYDTSLHVKYPPIQPEKGVDVILGDA